jgi:hypothetical protein
MSDTEQARQSLASALSRAADYLADRYAVAEVKSIGQIVREYADQLTNLVHDTFRTGDAIDQRRAHKALLRDLAPQVFVEGLREGDLAEDDMDGDDHNFMAEAVADWLAAQLPHVNSFATDSAAAKKDKDARPVILARVDLWVNALRDFGSMGKAYAQGNVKGKWQLGDTEHCASCLGYAAMKPRRMSWWLEHDLPRSSELDCGGFNCQCDIVDSKGNSLL